MKKNLFMAALALAAGTAFAAAQTDYSGVYSGQLTVNLGGQGNPADQNIEIYTNLGYQYFFSYGGGLDYSRN